LSPVDVVEAFLARIAAHNEKLHAYIDVYADDARLAAEAADKAIRSGHAVGPLHGVPIALKDLIDTAGVPTTGGSAQLADRVPTEDAEVTRRLRDAGAVLLGKLNLHEFAYGATSNNPHWGACHNPYDLNRIPGGSSGGSGAAIVARTAAATIGTDTGGSIRIPAACCGCVGLKQTWSRVSRYGVMPLSDSLDHTGPITRTARDAALMLNVIAGYDPNDATSSREPVPDYTSRLGGDLKGMRVGVIRELNTGVSEPVARAFSAALKQLGSLGATVEEVSIPSFVEGSLAHFTVDGTLIEAWAGHKSFKRKAT